MPKVQLLGLIIECLVLLETAKQFSREAVPFYISSSKVWLIHFSPSVSLICPLLFNPSWCSKIPSLIISFLFFEDFPLAIFKGKSAKENLKIFFPLCHNVFIYHSFLKDSLTQYRVHTWEFLSFSSWKSYTYRNARTSRNHRG